MPSPNTDTTAPPATPAAHDTPSAPPRLAGSSRKAWIILALTVLLATVADLGSKSWAFENIADVPVVLDRAQILERQANGVDLNDPNPAEVLVPLHEPVVVVAHVLEFKLILNAGAVFGSGQGKRWFFVGFTVVALAFAVFLFARWCREKEYLSQIALGLVIAGGLGNLYDRIMYACVRDFLHPLPGVEWPFGWEILGRTEVWPYVSNVADAFLLIGIAVLMIKLLREDGDAGKTKPEPNAA
ncbi:MAG: signal peptidase II [Phycisphaerales bacterium JB050]